ncbi:MAG: FliM/FliN family flagellar motor switch protein [Chthoniobacterales bacterium]|nr:FliM/FliN family flagellar motor switch protein [Chthoniobacterales bacterium]
MANDEDIKPEEVEKQTAKEALLEEQGNSNETELPHVESDADMSPSKEIAPQEVSQQKMETMPSMLKGVLDPLKSNDEKETGVVQSKESLKDSSASPHLNVELDFSLGHQSIPMEELVSLIEGKVIALGGSQFEASIMLHEKVIAQAQLILVEGVPSLQITKTVSF